MRVWKLYSVKQAKDISEFYKYVASYITLFCLGYSLKIFTVQLQFIIAILIFSLIALTCKCLVLNTDHVNSGNMMKITRYGELFINF